MSLSVVKMFLFFSAISHFTPEVVNSSPVRQATIDNPCSLVNGVSQLFPPLQTQLINSVSDVNIANLSVNELKELLGQFQFLPAEVKQDMNKDNLHLEGLPLRINTEGENVTFNVSNLDEVLRYIYRDVSVYIVYVQQAIIELVDRDRNSLGVPLGELKNFLFGLLCGVDTTLRSRGQAVTSFVNDSVMPEYLKNLSNSEARYRRDYLLSSDLIIFLDNLKTNYTALLDSLD